MIQLGMNTNKGVQRMKNEDALEICKEQQVYMVADGVGGNNSGELASQMAVEFISAKLSQGCQEKLQEEDVKNCFTDILRRANGLILQLAKESADCKGMATTLVLAYIQDNQSFVFNVGDSRAYLFRRGKLKQITEDHSFVNTLVKIGTISKEESRCHPKKNIITRALGAEEEVEIDYFITALEKEDVLLLCTDGLHGEIGDEVISRVISEERDMQTLCDRLISLANDSGGSDNITIICLRYKGETNEC